MADPSSGCWPRRPPPSHCRRQPCACPRPRHRWHRRSPSSLRARRLAPPRAARNPFRRAPSFSRHASGRPDVSRGRRCSMSRSRRYTWPRGRPSRPSRQSRTCARASIL
eukprot:2553777-Prymnesium_polylepis.1